MKYYFWVLLMVKLFISINYSDQKRPNLPICLKNIKNIYLAPATRPGNGFSIITWEIFIFEVCSSHDSTSASNFWSKEIQFGYLWTISTLNQYEERHCLVPIGSHPKSVPGSSHSLRYTGFTSKVRNDDQMGN